MIQLYNIRRRKERKRKKKGKKVARLLYRRTEARKSGGETLGVMVWHYEGCLVWMMTLFSRTAGINHRKKVRRYGYQTRHESANSSRLCRTYVYFLVFVLFPWIVFSSVFNAQDMRVYMFWCGWLRYFQRSKKATPLLSDHFYLFV